MYTIIVNPVAGRGQAMRILPGIRALLEEKGSEVSVLETTECGEAASLAARAADSGAECVIALGGDGTLSETASGLAGRKIPMIVAPCGMGNDFVRLFHLPKDPIEAVKAQLDRAARPCDLCRVNDRVFLNVAGTGLDVDVLLKTDKYKGLYSGLGVYLRGVRDSVRGYAPSEVEVEIDGGETERIRFSVLSLGNGRYIGGGMKAVPNADPRDGKLDFVVVKAIKK